MVVHRGGCHCGAIRFEVDAPAQIDATLCSCSICSMTPHLHLDRPQITFQAAAGR